MLTALLSALGIAPKTLPQARETIDASRAFAESVNALFTAAGLNLEQLLAAGPDSLKAHLDSLDNSAELADALTEIARYDEELGSAQEQLSALSSQLSAFQAIASTIGVPDLATVSTPPEAIAAAFTEHIHKATTLALAQTGHPPVVHIPADAEPAATAADHLAVYRSMPQGPERLAYFAKHEQAILAAFRGAKS